MKHLILTAALALLSAPAMADQLDCEMFYDLGQEFMTMRQNLEPMPEAMKVAGDDRLKKALVRDAYTNPYMQTEQYKQQAINEFSNNAYLACSQYNNQNG